MTKLHAFTADYRRDDGRGLVNKGLFLSYIPRPVLTCHLRGHKPVVDGVGVVGTDGYVARWVVCDRCGTRPNPQGSLDSEAWNVGDPFVRQYGATGAMPGPWPKTPTWDLSTQLCIGSSSPGFGAELKVGSGGSENATAGHLRLGRLFAIYVSTGELGRGLQRRLNPTGYESKVTGLTVGHGRIHWQVMAPRDSWSRSTPRWRDGSIRYRILDILLGEKRYAYEDVDQAAATLTLPHGDAHEITMRLQRRTVARKRGRSRFDAWTVDWDARAGIPTKPHGRGNVSGMSVQLTGADIDAWQPTALESITAQITNMRDRDDYVRES